MSTNLLHWWSRTVALGASPATALCGRHWLRSGEGRVRYCSPLVDMIVATNASAAVLHLATLSPA